jgi:hypothetical protein
LLYSGDANDGDGIEENTGENPESCRVKLGSMQNATLQETRDVAPRIN